MDSRLLTSQVFNFFFFFFTSVKDSINRKKIIPYNDEKYGIGANTLYFQFIVGEKKLKKGKK